MRRLPWVVVVLSSCASAEEVRTAPCGIDRPETLASCVDVQRYADDLRFVAQPREPGSDHWTAVQRFLRDRLVVMGYDVEVEDEQGVVNVVGRRTGVDEPDEQIVVSAHYDHIPGCEGADDNGSGVAALLEIARAMAQVNFRRTVVIAFWDKEEEGLVGSGVYARRARWRGDIIRAAFVLETIGYRSDEEGSQRIPPGFDIAYPRQVKAGDDNGNRGDFVTVITEPSSVRAEEAFVAYAEAIALKTIRLHTAPAQLPFTRNLRRSDHQSFWSSGYPAMMLTDTAEFRNEAYHCRNGRDLPDRLDHAFATDIARSTLFAAATLAGMR